MSAPAARAAVSKMSVQETTAISSDFLRSITEPGPADSLDSKLKFTKIQAIQHIREGEHGAAIQLLTHAIKLHAKDVELLWLRARASAANDNHTLAKEDCRAALVMNSDFIPARLTLAASTLETEGPAEALNILDDLHSDHSDDCFLFYLKGIASLKSGDFSNAIQRFDAALLANATYLPVPSCRIWHLRGIALEKAGSLELALNSALRAVEANGQDNQSLLLLWKLQRKSKHLVAALGTAKKMVDVNPNVVRQEVAMMISLVDLRQFSAATKHARHILALDPENQLAQKILNQIQIAKKSLPQEIL